MTKTMKSNSATVLENTNSRSAKRGAAPAKATKKARLIALLSRKSGADEASLSETLGWLPHSTRAALTGLRKAGYEITSIKPGNGKPLRYQIVGVPGAEAI